MNDNKATWITPWSKTIREMPVSMYCDWRKAGRPGFAPEDNLKLQQWCKTWRIAHRAVPHQGRGS